MSDEAKGLILSLFRSKSFGTNAKCNLLAGVDEVTLTEIHHADGRKTALPKGSRVFAATEDRPAVALVERKIFGTGSTWNLRPLSHEGWTMAGGTFASSSDSRFSKITGLYAAIAVHDWVE